MYKTHLTGYAFVVMLVGALFMVANADTIWSLSVDIAHHYALIFRISENWQLIPNDPSLGEMNYYPRASHVLAALAGTVVGSPLLGMHLVSLASLVILWGSCLGLLYATPGRQGALGALALALLVVVNHGSLRIHGAEIAPNYFYSQLVAQAFAFLSILIAVRIEMRWHRAWVYLFLLTAIWALVDVHLLPALELLGVFAGVLLLDLFKAPAGRTRLYVGLSAALLVVAGVGAVVLHPSFSAMRSISENNGGLGLGSTFNTVLAIAVLCLIVLASTVSLLRAWWRAPDSHVMYKYLAMYGAAVAGLCLLQMVLRQFGLGSDYAVKKYVFGLLSFVFLRAALWAGNAGGAALTGAPRLSNMVRAEPFRLVAFGVALLLIVSQAARLESQLDTSNAVAVERQLTAARDSFLTPAPQGKTNLMADIDGMPVVANYMFSLAIAHTTREVAGHDFLAGTSFSPWDRYGTIVSSRASSRYAGAEQCSSIKSGPLLLLDPSCLARLQSEGTVCKGTFDFSLRGRIDPAMLTGFSGAEQDFRWTEGKQSAFTCNADKPYRLARLTLAPFLTPTHARQRVSVTVNDGAPVTVELRSPELAVIELPLPQLPPGQPVAIRIAMPDAVSPEKLGLSGDARELGVAVRTLSFE